MLISRRRAILMAGSFIAVQPLPVVGAPRTISPTPLPALPVALAQIRAYVQAEPKAKTINAHPYYRVTKQILKCEVLDFANNGQLEFMALDFDWLALYADIINISGSTNIKRTNSIFLDGQPGYLGRSAPPTPPGDGVNGQNGQPGGPGQDGRSQKVPTLYIFCQQITLNGIQAQPSDVGGPTPSAPVVVNFDGYDGGNGGDGGPGGDASSGNRGTPAVSGLGGAWCDAGPGWGGRGGNAGAGGTPGMGANGTDGGGLYLFVAPGQEATFGAVTLSNRAGRAGHNGSPGRPGVPGRGGPEGPLAEGCTSANRHGANGIVPAPCSLQEYRPHDGIDGPAPVVQTYTGFSELNS